MPLQNGYTHVYATCHGEWNKTGVWSGETAMCGFRIAAWPSATNVKLIGPLPEVFGLEPKLELDTSSNWNTVLRWEDDGFGGLAQWTAGAQYDVAMALHTWMLALKPRIGPQFTWTGIKIAPIAANGKYAQGSTEYNFTEVGKVTGSGTDHLPPEVTIASSYGSDVPGRSGRSRVYIPGLIKNQIDTNGQVSSVVAGALNTAMLALHNNIATQVGAASTIYRIVSTSAGNPNYVLPKSVWVGSHADAQRRRQHQSIETKYTAAIPL